MSESPEEARAPAGFLSTLRRQVIVAMAVSLSPLLIMGGLRVISEQEDARAERFQELLDTSRDRIVDIESMLGQTRLALRLVAKDESRPDCSAIGQRIETLELPVANIIRFDAEGYVTCHHIGEDLIGLPMPSLEWNDQLRKGRDLLEASDQPGMALGGPRLFILRAQSGADGSFAGSVAFSIDLNALSRRMIPGTSAAAMLHHFVLSDGTVIGSDSLQALPQEWVSNEAVLERRPRNLTLPQGRRADLVVQPLSAEGVWLMTASPAQLRDRPSIVIAFVVPVLVYLAALLAASWIVDSMVLRWLERIRMRISDFRRSGKLVPISPDLSHAPGEFQHLGEAFDDLAQRVTANEGELQGALLKMRGAFRETHHRVKNNLQVMLSMLKLQGRGEALPETQQALRVAAHRVGMMAAVHHTLLNEVDLETVDAGELFHAICNQIDEQQGWFEGARHVVPDVEPVPLPADFAVPLAMFVLEAFNLLCRMPEESEGRDLLLSFTASEGAGQLTLTCAGGNSDSDPQTTIDPGFFLGAFARQIGGSVHQQAGKPGKVVLVLEFPLSPAAPNA